MSTAGGFYPCDADGYYHDGGVDSFDHTFHVDNWAATNTLQETFTTPTLRRGRWSVGLYPTAPTAWTNRNDGGMFGTPVPTTAYPVMYGGSGVSIPNPWLNFAGGSPEGANYGYLGYYYDVPPEDTGDGIIFIWHWHVDPDHTVEKCILNRSTGSPLCCNFTVPDCMLTELEWTTGGYSDLDARWWKIEMDGGGYPTPVDGNMPQYTDVRFVGHLISPPP